MATGSGLFDEVYLQSTPDPANVFERNKARCPLAFDHVLDLFLQRDKLSLDRFVAASQAGKVRFELHHPQYSCQVQTFVRQFLDPPQDLDIPL